MADNSEGPPEAQVDIIRELDTLLHEQRHAPREEVEHRIGHILQEIDKHESFHPKIVEYLDNILEDQRRLPPIGRRLEGDIKEIDTKIRSNVDKLQKLDKIELDSEKNIVFLLGAGASVASGIPTVNGLLDELLQQAERTQRDDLEPLIEYCNEMDDIDIEDLLTAAYLSDFAVTDRHVVQILHYFLFSEENVLGEETPQANPTSVNFIQDTLQTLFGLITSTMIPAEPNETHEAVREFIENHDGTSIITTNYDYCMDEELISNGKDLRTQIEEPDHDETQDSVELLKMHGSINWSYCESCQSSGNIKPTTVKSSFGQDSLDYPVIGICPICNGQRRPLLVPPTSFKFIEFPPLIEIWNRAKYKLDQADHIFAIGYSFSDSDAYIYKLIANAMTGPDGATMVLVNPNEDVTGRLRDQFSTELDSFDPEQRIIGIHGQSQKIVPKIADKLLPSEENKVSDNSGEEKASTDD